MTSEASSIISRRDRASLRPRNLAFAAEKFRLNLWRMELSRCQVDLALLICRDTLESGFHSQVYSKLEDIVREPAAVDNVLNYGRNDISAALNGTNGKGGLVQYGIVRAEACDAGGRMVWLVSVVTDAAMWRCSERIPSGRLESRAGALLALRRECSPFLPTLEPAPDLWDALAADSERSEPAEESSAGALARRCSARAGMIEEMRAGARRCLPEREGDGIAQPCSEFQNAERPIKSRETQGCSEFQNSPVNSLTDLTGNRNLTVQPLNSYCKGGLENELMDMIRSEFVRAHGIEAAAREMANYGGAWRSLVRWFPATVEASVGELRHKNNQREKFHRGAWHWLRADIFRCLGVKSWPQAREKASKNPIK